MIKLENAYYTNIIDFTIYLTRNYHLYLMDIDDSLIDYYKDDSKAFRLYLGIVNKSRLDYYNKYHKFISEDESKVIAFRLLEWFKKEVAPL